MKSHTTSFHGITITVNDASDDILAALEVAKLRGLNAVGETAEGYAKGIILDAGRVDTGRMLNSTTHAEAGDEVYIGCNVDYAIYNEMGTTKMAGIHFIQSAAADHADEYKELIKESLQNA